MGVGVFCAFVISVISVYTALTTFTTFTTFTTSAVVDYLTMLCLIRLRDCNIRVLFFRYWWGVK